MRTRMVAPEDARALTGLLQLNREFLAPWEPLRSADHFTVEGQTAGIADALAEHARGTRFPHVILDDERIVGRITISNVVRGAFQSANLGYWVSGPDNGRGFASGAVAEMVSLAFGDLGLHRIEAGTLLHNVASQRVLERNRFIRFGVAPRYLNIAGTWQDHALYQALAPGAGA